MAQTIFGTEVPANLNNNDSPDQYTLRTRVQPLVDGQTTHGEWYFPTTSPTSPVQMGLYRNSDEALLGTATFSGGQANGRHQVPWSGGPITMLTGVEYTVAIWTSNFYVSTGGYFGTDKTSGDLYCPAVAGRFHVGPTLTFPDQQFGQANYWPDLVFETGADPAEGSAATVIDLASAGAGARDSDAAAALGLTLAMAATGARDSEGVAAAGLGLTVAAVGARPAGGAAGLGLTLVPSATGARSSRGTSALQVNFSISATGSNGQSGRPVKPWPGTVAPVSSYPWTPRPVRSFQEVDQP